MHEAVEPVPAFILEFDRLTPVHGPEPWSGSAVREIAGGRLPWLLRSGSGSLSRDGHLQVRVRGLVLAGHSSVPGSMRGTNPFPAFRAVVSCLRADSDGDPAIANVSTGDFPASSSGDADIDARLSLPLSCVAPVLLLTGPGGTEGWIAVTGS
jgi:hypothetical protein